MNARQRRKALKQRAADPDLLIRVDAKLDLLLEQSERMDQRAAIVGAVSGGLAGGAVAFMVAYAKVLLIGVR